ncbi:MAG TPA: HAMP domain-containing sensor histidine kinase [Clostridia bacterium]
MKISIKVKLSVFLTILLLAAVSTLSVLVLGGIRENQKQQYEEYLVQQGEIASNYIKQTYLMESIKDSKEFLKTRAQELVKRFELMNGMHVILYDMTGNEISNSRPAAGKTDVSSLLEYALQGKNAYMEEGDDIIFLSPLHNSSEQTGIIQFDYSIVKNKNFYEDIKHLFLYAGIFVFGICFICSYLYVFTLAQGISKLKNTAQRIEQGDYTDTATLKRNDELGELSQGIYSMGCRIKKNMDEMRDERNKLNSAVEKLKILGSQQKQFIGNVTHEFKTPLTVIKAYTDLMSMYPEDWNLITEARENIDKETQRLSSMVGKVLELSSTEKYDFELQMEIVDIYEILTDVCEHMKGKIQKFGLHLHTSFEHHRITADKESLMQIFINLIDNAIKYNRPRGEIWLACSRKDNCLNVLVKDTGNGIAQDERDKIFEPFYKVNKDRSSQDGSAGLGLALVKGLVEKQGATISILETDENGTSFIVKFPMG